MSVDPEGERTFRWPGMRSARVPETAYRRGSTPTTVFANRGGSLSRHKILRLGLRKENQYSRSSQKGLIGQRQLLRNH